MIKADSWQRERRSAEPAMPSSSDEWVTIAQIVGPFGVHGEMKIRLHTDIPNRLAQLKTVYIHYRPFTVRGTRTVGQNTLLHLEGIDNPELVRKLRGAAIQIPLAEIAPLPEGQYYIHDLIGLEVQTVQGETIGHVREVITTASNDVYAVDRPGIGEVLLPAIREIVKEIDLHARKMIIDPIPGLLDTAGPAE